ncbi:Serine/threonine protein phosphatase [Neorhizobium galegae bv. officinalis bv. officinalis str. HAMBI 1141]|uniref:Serine/threonine protein phosphatase n=1 Tax=Neorhizobium galegae bv. officinalis bv. officinalis str. HAMBI 1141 TaxID=1028801 RepID=A0A068T586_NEOGA|nr:metallophosphoesterase family protein [Neorhizobium galegae]CDN53682.1 Serine/threonine protein phosphatase [Neorhizobium galegae bv. officinalis bv. officinalis str. HAMBI 1141]
MSFTFAIGDIHGCLAQLKELLAQVEDHAPSGHVVFIGDYIDRGPKSRGVLDLVMAGPRKEGWRWTALKGNHEDMMVRAHQNGGHDEILWIDNGGRETMVSFDGYVPPEVLSWCAHRPLMHVDEHRIFVHAGVDETLPLEGQRERDLIWKRFASDDDGEFWGRHLCHGHTALPGNPRTVGNRTNIDSGCVFGGELTCAVFDDDEPGGPVEFLRVPG